MLRHYVVVSIAIIAFWPADIAHSQRICNEFLTELHLESYKRIGDSFYLIENTTKANWFGAYNKCRSKNGYLTSIESIAELREISVNLNKYERYWVSGTDLAHPGEFVWWTTGNDIPKYDWLWNNGQPDNYDKNERCTVLGSYSSKLQLNDRPCTELQYYVCKIDKDVLKVEALKDVFKEILPNSIKCPTAKLQ